MKNLSKEQNFINKINELNYKFYKINAQSFSNTRSKAWQGWDKLLPLILQFKSKSLKILDLGCGNGRFIKFLCDKKINSHYLLKYCSNRTKRDIVKIKRVFSFSNSNSPRIKISPLSQKYYNKE